MKARPTGSGERVPGASRRLLYCLLGLSVLALPATAGAAKIKGRLEGFRLLTNPVWTEARDPKHHGYSFREPVPTVRAEFRRLYPHVPKELCVAALAAGPQKPPLPILIRVGGGRTTPVTIVVPPGTRLTFQNTDPFKHRLYGVGIKTFPPNDSIRGATRDWTVGEPGTYEIRDELAPSLRMFVVSEPNVATVSYPSLKGEFALNVEQPGDYTVQAFFNGKKIGQAIPVKVEGGDVDIAKHPIKVGDQKTAEAADKAEKEDKERAEKAEQAEKEGKK